MILFWIITAILYGIIVFLVHKFFWNEMRGDEKSNKGRWKFWTQTFYWQGALLLGLGILAVILALAKWTDILPNMD